MSDTEPTDYDVNCPWCGCPGDTRRRNRELEAENKLLREAKNFGDYAFAAAAEIALLEATVKRLQGILTDIGMVSMDEVAVLSLVREALGDQA